MSDETPDEGERIPPHDEAAELAALGSMLLSAGAVDDVFAAAKPRDFYVPRHELIFDAILRLVGQSKPTDAVSVIDELTKAGELTRAGGAVFVWSLSDHVTTAANAGYHAQLVAEKAERRRMVEAGTRITQMGYASEGENADLIEHARIELDRVTSGSVSQVHMIGDRFAELVDHLAAEPTYLSTPWPSLDKIIGGLGAGELIVVAARPGSGKSIAVLQMAAHLAHRGVVALSSLEMTEQALQLRLLAQFGDIHMTALRKHWLNDADWDRIAKARARLIDAPIFVDETPGVGLAHIRAHARAVARRGDLAAVFVDYMQLVQGEGQSRQEVVSNVAQGLKNLAKDFHVPAVAAAQLKRPDPRRGRQLPTLDDLRESGGIENNADVVLLLDRDAKDHPNELTVIIAKNRNGELGKFTLRWEAAYARVVELPWSATALIAEEDIP